MNEKFRLIMMPNGFMGIASNENPSQLVGTYKPDFIVEILRWMNAHQES